MQSLRDQYPEESQEALLGLTLSEAFPSSTLLQEINKSWINEVTLLDLLTHRSGLPDYIGAFEQKPNNPERLNKPIDSVDILQKISFNSSKPYLYSNRNYFLLGKFIEEMHNASYEEVFESMVKDPAHMTSSYAPSKGNYYTLKELDKFQELKADLNQKIFIDFANVGGAGGIISTSIDLTKWNDYLHHKIDNELKNILLKTYGEDQDGDRINLGLSTSKTNIGDLVGFQGHLDSYHSFLGFFPDQNRTIIILSNNDNDYEKIFDDAVMNGLIEPRNEL